MRFVCCFRMFKSTRRKDLYLTYIILLISAIECILFRILRGGIRFKINTNLQYSSNFRLRLCIVQFPTGVYTETLIYFPSDYFIFWYLQSTYRRDLFEYQPSYCGHSLYLIGLGGGATTTIYVNFILEWFSIQFHKTKTNQLITN